MGAARKYSEEEAYKGHEFPVVTDDAVCVLCHQSLPGDAKERFTGFESYVKEKTQMEANKAHEDWNKAVQETLQNDIPEEGHLMEKIDEAGLLENSNVKESLLRLYKALRVRKEKLSALKTGNEIPTMPSHQCIEDIKYIRNTSEQERIKYSQKGNQVLLNSLQARKWLFENRNAIEEEIKRCQRVDKIKKAKHLTDTRSLSIQKGNLSLELITKAFVDWFNRELKRLNASKVKAKIEQSHVEKGKVLHRLILEGTSGHPPLKEVLSEGERKIVSIAAFLADIKGKELKAPIVFDDPTSSLDQDFEKSFAERLDELPKERQVIVFTHRIPLLRHLRDSKKETTECICIEKDNQVSGEPKEMPFNINRTKRALNTILCSVEKQDSSIGDWCRQFRITLERMIECDLLSGIVGRDREVIYVGKISKLVPIKEKDTQFLTELWKKYSSPMHSSSDEDRTTDIKWDELKKDVKKLQEWQCEFGKRKGSKK